MYLLYSQLSESAESLLLSALMLLQELLNNYSDSLSEYRPPESCDPRSILCTEGQLHANDLAFRAAFIAKLV